MKVMVISAMGSSFSEIVERFNKTNKSELITQGVKMLSIPRIPFSSPYMNYLLHGGFPRGKTVEFFGEEAGGKSTTAIDVMANAQKVFEQEWKEELEKLSGSTKKSDILLREELQRRGALRVVLFDLEMSFDENWGRTLGLDTQNNFYLVRPESQSAEELLDLLVQMVACGEVGLIVLDSIPSLIPQAIINESLEKKEYGGISKILTAFFRKVTPFLNTTTTSLLLINQVRDSMNPYKLYETPGGRALKHACDVRMMFRKGDLYNEKFEVIKKSSERAYGNEVIVRIEKNKICTPDRLLGSYVLGYYSGIEWVYDLVDILISAGTIVVSGSWFSLTDPETGELLENYKVQGKQKVVTLLKETPELLNMYLTFVNEKIVK